jgi:predicted O-methyltransferase YrrM
MNDEFFGGDTFSVDGVEFVCAYGQSTAERFCVLKRRDQVEVLMDIVHRFRSSSIVELGIAAGGSTALVTLLANPRRLIAIDIASERVTALDDLIIARGLEHRVRPFYGIDQADRQRVLEIVTSELGHDPLDLVIDDASHLLAETTSSFETLFPMLRPGGLYVIEDWNSWHVGAEAFLDALGDDEGVPTPLSPLLMELVLVRATSPDIVGTITIGDLWATIERGSAPLDPVDFRVADAYTDHFGLASPGWHPTAADQ